jgi:hypothetical protein
MNHRTQYAQRGLSLVGLIFILAIVAMIAVLGMKLVPTVIEYSSIRKAIVSAKTSGSTVREIQSSFDRQATVGYIDAITGKDLEISKIGNEIEVSFAYQKKIPLFGPASLLIEYAGTTAKTAATKTIE